jgi:steroid delta-isomerase-like uncharacterized protein
MHRRSIALAGVALVLGSPFDPGAYAAGAQVHDGTPDALPEPFANWVVAWETRPLVADPIAAAYVENAVYEEVASGIIRTGREEILAYLTDFFTAFTDGRASVETAFAAGEQGAAMWTFNGRYTGQLPGFPPGADQPISFRGASILVLREGAIVRETQFFDVYGLLIQLGAAPAPGPVSTPAA